MRIRYIPFLLSVFFLVSFFNSDTLAQTDDELGQEEMAYFGQKVPAMKPLIFAPNLISKPNRNEFGSVFSKNGREFYFGVADGNQEETYYSKLKNGVWSNPEKLFNNVSYSYNDPMLSPDESRLYYISNKPINKGGKNKDIDIWYSEREGENWSEPINAGDKINSSRNEYFISFSDNGTMYFASNANAEDGKDNNFDIYSSELKDGEYQEPQKLPEQINTNRYEADVFIAPDESYIIFCARRSDGLGMGDLYISFKDKEGKWTSSINMGESINSEKHELCPFVSKDGKYLFYTSNKDIYWVSSKILQTYKEK